MKVRIDMEIDMISGAYDVRFHNLTRPGDDIDVPRLTTIMHRVIDNVAIKTSHDHDTSDEAPSRREQWDKHDIN